jgi:hypothetical protein
MSIDSPYLAFCVAEASCSTVNGREALELINKERTDQRFVRPVSKSPNRLPPVGS